MLNRTAIILRYQEPFVRLINVCPRGEPGSTVDVSGLRRNLATPVDS
jgi:hypothetical protein